MKILKIKIFKFLFISLFLSACTNNVQVKKKDEKIDYECEGNVKTELICQFPYLKIILKNKPQEMDTKFALDTYKWFMSQVFYGNEIYSLDSIVFDGSVKNGKSLGHYVPAQKQISIFPNNKTITYNSFIGPTIAKRFEKDEIGPNDLFYWQYIISHEYGHHQTVSYATNGEFSSNKVGEINQDDIVTNKVGDKWFSIFGYDEVEQFKNPEKIRSVLFASYKVEDYYWPNHSITEVYNKYLWTRAEILTRDLQFLTYQVPKQLQNDNSVNAFGGIINDYWWRGYYGINVYETHKTKDKKRTPIQKPVDTYLTKWAKYIKDDYFNDDQLLSTIFQDKESNIFINTNVDGKLSLQKINDNSISDFTKMKSKTRIFYNWRPFDSRKEVKINYHAIPFKINQPTPGKYYILFNGKKISEGFGLEKENDSRIIWAKEYQIIISKIDGEMIFEIK